MSLHKIYEKTPCSHGARSFDAQMPPPLRTSGFDTSFLNTCPFPFNAASEGGRHS